MITLAVRPRWFHFRKRAHYSRGALDGRHVWLLEIADAGGARRGLGECGPIPRLSHDDDPGFGAAVFAFAAHFNRSVAALDCADADHAGPDKLAWAGRVLAPFEADLEALPSLRFGLECALLDYAWGGSGLFWPSPFACAGAPLPTHGLIWMDSLEGMRQQAGRKYADGFRVFKLKVGRHGGEAETTLVAEFGTRWAGASVRLDANGEFEPAGALEAIAAFAGGSVEFLEQPIAPGQRTDLRRICAESPVPIALDEELIGLHTPAARRALLDEVRPQHVVLKPALLGGFLACDDWIAACRERGIQWWGNSLLETAPGHAAVCQWIGARDPVRTHGLGTGGLYLDNLPSPIRQEGAALRCEPLCAPSWGAAEPALY